MDRGGVIVFAMKEPRCNHFCKGVIVFAMSGFSQEVKDD